MMWYRSGTAEVPRSLSVDMTFLAYAFWDGIFPFGAEFFWSPGGGTRPESHLLGIDLIADLLYISGGVSLAWDITDGDPVPYFGGRIGFLDFPISVGDLFFGPSNPAPLIDWGMRLLPMSIRWNLGTGEFRFTIGLGSVTLGHTFWDWH